MVTERRISVCHEETYPDKGKKRSWKVQKALVSRGQGYAPDDHQYCADAHIIPRLMPELDRTRTRTRLGAGQGSGRPGHESVFDLSIHIQFHRAPSVDDDDGHGQVFGATASQRTRQRKEISQWRPECRDHKGLGSRHGSRGGSKKRRIKTVWRELHGPPAATMELIQ